MNESFINNTYIKLFRKTLNWEWFSDVPTCHLFVYLLLRAQYNEKSFRGIKVFPGELTTSVQIISDESGLSVQQVRTALKKLKLTNEIDYQSTNKFTHIKIIKWADYQDYDSDINKQNNKQDNNQITNEQQTDNKRITTIKEYKESKEYKEYKNNIIAPSYNSSNAVEKLPTNKTNEFYYIHTEDIEKYKSYYPAVDIEQEFRNMSAWLDANSKNRKTHNGMARFINSWLSKAQNKTRAFSEKPKEKKGIDFFYE